MLIHVWFEPNPIPTSPGLAGSRSDKSRRRGIASSQSKQESSGSIPAGAQESGSMQTPRCRAGQRPFTDWAPGRSKLEPSSLPVARRGCGSCAPAPPVALQQPRLSSRSRGHLMTLITRSMAVVKAISANRLWKCSRWGTGRRKGRGWGTPGFFPAFSMMFTMRDPLPLFPATFLYHLWSLWLHIPRKCL